MKLRRCWELLPDMSSHVDHVAGSRFACASDLELGIRSERLKDGIKDDKGGLVGGVTAGVRQVRSCCQVTSTSLRAAAQAIQLAVRCMRRG